MLQKLGLIALGAISALGLAYGLLRLNDWVLLSYTDQQAIMAWIVMNCHQ
jgi:hypothetical protein